MRWLYERTHERVSSPSRWDNGCQLREPIALFFILHVLGMMLGGIIKAVLFVVRLCSWGRVSRAIDNYHTEQYEKMPKCRQRL